MFKITRSTTCEQAAKTHTHTHTHTHMLMYACIHPSSSDILKVTRLIITQAEQQEEMEVSGEEGISEGG